MVSKNKMPGGKTFKATSCEVYGSELTSQKCQEGWIDITAYLELRRPQVRATNLGILVFCLRLFDVSFSLKDLKFRILHGRDFLGDLGVHGKII